MLLGWVNTVVSFLFCRFLSTEKGGHLSEENGALERKWKWPQANIKITEPISFQVTQDCCFLGNFLVHLRHKGIAVAQW